MSRSTLTAYVDDERLLVYGDDRSKVGDPCFAIHRDSWLSLARFLLEIYEDELWRGEEIGLYGTVDELTEEA